MKSLMNSFRKPARRFGLAVLATACIGMPSALAQDEALPSGEDVVKMSIKAMGGEEAFANVKNRVITGTMGMPAMGMNGTIKTYQKRPADTLIEINIPNMMQVKQGFSHGTAWEINSMLGPRILEGAERALIVFSARFDDSDLSNVFSSIKCTGVEDVNGEACYVLVMEMDGIAPITSYISKETHLNVKINMTINSGLGEMEIESFTTDYKEVDGLLYSHRTEQKVMGQEIVNVIEKIEHNVDLEAGVFDIPEEVKALLSADDPEEEDAGQEDAGQEDAP